MLYFTFFISKGHYFTVALFDRTLSIDSKITVKQETKSNYETSNQTLKLIFGEIQLKR